jgi:F-type H+-transporting ATPase subunit epsilon
MRLEVISIKGVLLKSEVTSVILPGMEGSFGILPDHTPFLSILRQGTIHYFEPEEKTLLISGGFVEVMDNRICVCVTDK